MTTDYDYEQAELKGRTAFSRLIQENSEQARRLGSLQFANTDARYDCSCTWNGAPCVVEIKSRPHSISKYPTYILERDKWMALAYHHRKGTQVYYTMIFDEGNGNHTGLMFDLSRRFEGWGLNGEGHFHPSQQPTKTVEDAGKKEKFITLLSVEEGDVRLSNLNKQ